METTEFKPTHRLLHNDKVVDVMLVGNVAYLEEDWKAATVSDLELDEDDGWLFKGFPGPVLIEELST